MCGHHSHRHPFHQTRRDFIKTVAAGPLAITALAVDAPGAVQPQKPAVDPEFDLIIKGGRVIDPSQGLSALRDVGIKDHSIARIAQNLPADSARRVMDARGKLVTPGLIDIHVHVYDGVTPLGIPADPNCIAKGVTTAVDAGSAGAHTFPGFRTMVVKIARTRVYALLNISVIGQSTLSADTPYGELLDLRYANPKLAVRTVEANRDVILGIKIRASSHIAGENDLAALKLAREAAEAVRLPIMIHIGGTHSPLGTLLEELRKGDVVTHTYKAGPGGVLTDNGRVLPEVRRAVDRGVHLDVGHGTGSFSWRVAEQAIRQDLWPGTISSDIHHYNVHGPVFDLATTISKFMHLGLSLEDAVARVTSHPANVFAFPKGLGTLRPGAEADVAVFDLAEGDFEMHDAAERVIPGITVEPGEGRRVHRKLVPLATVKAGKIYGAASIPVEDRYR